MTGFHRVRVQLSRQERAECERHGLNYVLHKKAVKVHDNTEDKQEGQVNLSFAEAKGRDVKVIDHQELKKLREEAESKGRKLVLMPVKSGNGKKDQL